MKELFLQFMLSTYRTDVYFKKLADFGVEIENFNLNKDWSDFEKLLYQEVFHADAKGDVITFPNGGEIDMSVIWDIYDIKDEDEFVNTVADLYEAFTFSDSSKLEILLKNRGYGVQ